MPYENNQSVNRELLYRTIIQKYEISEEYGKRMQMLQGALIFFFLLNYH